MQAVVVGPLDGGVRSPSAQVNSLAFPYADSTRLMSSTIRYASSPSSQKPGMKTTSPTLAERIVSSVGTLVEDFFFLPNSDLNIRSLIHHAKPIIPGLFYIGSGA